jgi:hypothetical protein
VPAVVLVTVEEGTQPEVAVKTTELHGEGMDLDEGEGTVTRAAVPAPGLASLAMPPSTVTSEGKKMGAATAP